MAWDFKKKLEWYTVIYFILLFLIRGTTEYANSAIIFQFILAIWIIVEIYNDAKKNKMSTAWALSGIFGILGPWTYNYYTPKAKKDREKQKKYLFGMDLATLILLGIVLLLLLWVAIMAFSASPQEYENNTSDYDSIDYYPINYDDFDTSEQITITVKTLKEDWTEGVSCEEYIDEKYGTVDLCQSGCYYTEDLDDLIHNADYYMELDVEGKTDQEINKEGFYASYCLEKVVEIAFSESNITICEGFDTEILNETCVKWYNEK